jgi:hypothetical protein
MAVPEHSAAQSQRPVIAIPGILGSKLADANGEILWGDCGSLRNLGRLDPDPAGTRSKIRHVAWSNGSVCSTHESFLARMGQGSSSPHSFKTLS